MPTRSRTVWKLRSDGQFDCRVGWKINGQGKRDQHGFGCTEPAEANDGIKCCGCAEVDGSEHGDERQLLFFYSSCAQELATLEPNLTFSLHRLGVVAGESRVSSRL
ncbi:MAG: hypothetical protein R3C99_01645 [Pirellulaceae bacterium]